jgi:F-type H+-transporting ATPase subunit delta
MRGASEESLAALTDELGQTKGLLPTIARLAAKVTGGATGAADDEAADGGRTADDLFGAAAVLRRETNLRRTLTDGSLPAEPKVGLVRQIFGGAVSSASVQLLSSAVGRSWTAPRDLADALEHLGVVAVVKGAEQRDEADALENELFSFGRIVAESSELRDALSDPARSVEDKQALVSRLLEGRATAATVRLAQQSVTGSYRTVALAVEDYQNIAAQHRNRLVATVRVAHALSADDERRLTEALAGQYGRPVHLNTMIDPDVIGGMRVEIGDDVIDGTVSNRLDEARRRLAG